MLPKEEKSQRFGDAVRWLLKKTTGHKHFWP